MKITTNSLLTLTNLIGLFNWDVKSLLTKPNNFNASYPLVLFGQFLSKAKIDKIKINDKEEYKILGVRSYGKGVFLNRIVKGETLTMKEYQKAKPNHLFWCKVDTKNGAFGIIKENLADGIASSNMTFAEINIDKINVDFLQFLFTSKGVMEYLDSFVTGTTNRKYIRPEQLLNEIKIPLPTLSEQNELVNAYTTKIKEANELMQEANDLEGEIEKYLYEALGIEIDTEKNISSLLQFIDFKETHRWDTLFLLGKIPTIKSKYNLVRFQDVITSFNKDTNNKSLRIDSSKFPNKDFRYIGMEHIEKQTGAVLDMPVVSGAEIKSQTISVPPNFLVYGKLRPYLNKYWINDTIFDDIICSSEFFVFDINTNINKLFFKNVLSSQIIQSQISDKTSGARMPRINEDIFFELKIPLPKRDIQDMIASNIENLKSKIKSCKIKSETIKHEAKQAFEQAIFNT